MFVISPSTLPGAGAASAKCGIVVCVCVCLSASIYIFSTSEKNLAKVYSPPTGHAAQATRARERERTQPTEPTPSFFPNEAKSKSSTTENARPKSKLASFPESHIPFITNKPCSSNSPDADEEVKEAPLPPPVADEEGESFLANFKDF